MQEHAIMNECTYAKNCCACTEFVQKNNIILFGFGYLYIDLKLAFIVENNKFCANGNLIF